MKIIFRFASVVAFVCAATWMIYDYKFDSIFAFSTSLAGVLASFITTKEAKNIPSQKQSVTKSSNGIQAGRDVNINK